MMSFGAAAAIAATGSVKLHDPLGHTVKVAACPCAASAPSANAAIAKLFEKWLIELCFAF
jgi:hypothetical protein